MPRGEKSARRYLRHEKNPTTRAIYRCFLPVLFISLSAASSHSFPWCSPSAARLRGATGAFPHHSPSVPGLILPFDGL